MFIITQKTIFNIANCNLKFLLKVGKMNIRLKRVIFFLRNTEDTSQGQKDDKRNI